MKIKTLYIFYHEEWPELYTQQRELDKIGEPYIEYESTVMSAIGGFANAGEIPFIAISSDQVKIDPAWLDTHIRPLGRDYDEIIFHIPSSLWKGGRDNAHCYMGYGKPTIITCHSYRGEQIFGNLDPRWKDKGFYERAQHERGHSICDILDKPDLCHAMEAIGQLWRKEWFEYLGLISTPQENIMKSIISALQALIPLYQKQIQYQKLKNAIIQVESGGDDSAYNPDDVGSPSYGPFQIKQVYLDDVNRSWGTKIKGEELIGNRPLSSRVFDEYMNIWANKKRLGRDATFEDMARIHNGGPMGYIYKSTIPYWEKVKKYL